MRGFYDGDGEFAVRFSPNLAGCWTYQISSPLSELRRESLMRVLPVADGQHSPVKATGPRRFSYANGSDFYPVGTTAYAWAHQGAAMREATLRTLQQGPGRAFNKIRFSVFPKWYSYNHEEPPSQLYPYEGRPPSGWDFRQFDPTFWRQFETLIGELRGIGVIADVILFHPYDHGHWNFDCMGGDASGAEYNLSNDIHYLRYAIARLGSYSNVWWSMANEWDFIRCKSQGLPTETAWGKDAQAASAPTWDALFAVLDEEDAHQRETSIHNAKVLYNHSKPFIDHVSLQGLQRATLAIAERYGKPVIWDEVGYEGDLPEQWGALTGVTAADRFWWAASLGAYAGHSECILQTSVSSDEQRWLWWSRGGSLQGSSALRILWFREYFTHQVPTPHRLQLEDANHFTGCAGRALVANASFALFHFRERGMCTLSLPQLPQGYTLRVTLLHWWTMTRTILFENASNGVMIPVGQFGHRLPCNIELQSVQTMQQ